MIQLPQWPRRTGEAGSTRLLRFTIACGTLAALTATPPSASATPPADARPLDQLGFTFTPTIQLSWQRSAFGHSSVGVGEWLYVGGAREISRFRRSDLEGRLAFAFEGTTALGPPGSSYTGMWLARAGNHLFAGGGKLPSLAVNDNYQSSDIADVIIEADGTLVPNGWLNVPSAGVPRCDGATLVAPLPGNGWPGAESTPGIVLCPLTDEGAPTTSVFMPIPGAITNARSADVSGDWIAVGFPEATIYGLSNAGRVAILHRADDGLWSVHQWLLPPTGLASMNGHFGKFVAIDGDTLVVGAPLFVGAEPAMIGAAGVFVRGADGLYSLTHIIEPKNPLEYLGASVAVKGTLVAVGGTGIEFENGADGIARLYRHEGGGLEELLAVSPFASEPCVGRALDLVEVGGSQFFAVSAGPRSNIFSPPPTQPLVGSLVHLRDLSRELADCDGDGLRDGAAIDAGVAADCDRDRIPDACQVTDCDADGIADRCATAKVMAQPLSQGPRWSFALSPTALFHRLTVPADSTGIATSVVIECGRRNATGTVTVALYRDPNQDGLMDDATLVAMVPANITFERPVPALMNIPTTPIGPPGTTFFVGLILSGNQVNGNIRYDVTPTGDGFWYDGPLAEFDITHPGASGVIVPLIYPSGAGASLPIAVRFQSAIDINGNGLPDACECPADRNGDGTVNASDMATVLSLWGALGVDAEPGDVDGDGAVGAMDLSLVLAGWGACS